MQQMNRRALIVATCLLGATGLYAQGLARDSAEIERDLPIEPPGTGTPRRLDLSAAIRALNIPSVSVALIDGGTLDWARVFGRGATADTLYQAASLSKLVTAVAALRLGEQARLALDRDVNEQLTGGGCRTAPHTRPSGDIAGAAQHDGRDRRARLCRLCAGAASAGPRSNPRRRAAGELAAGPGRVRSGRPLCLFRRGLRDRAGADRDRYRPQLRGRDAETRPSTARHVPQHVCTLPIRLSPTAARGSVRPCSWTFTSVAIFGSHNRCQSSSDFFPTTRPAPPTWRRLAGATGTYAHCQAAGAARSASQIVLASCAAPSAAVTPD